MIGPSDIIARVGARTLLRYGVASRRLATIARGGEQMAEIFSRPDPVACASFGDPGGVLRLAEAGRLRLDWVDLNGDGIAEQACLLLENGVTNWALNNAAINLWTLGGATVTQNAIAAPTGVVEADKVVEQAAGGTHYHQTPSITVAASELISVSGFFKAGERPEVLWGVNNVANTVYFRKQVNLSTGAFETNETFGGASFVGTPQIYKRPDGWVWVRMAGKLTASDLAARITGFVGQAGGIFTYVGDGSSGLYSWGHGFERSVAWPSSWIPCGGAAQQRAQDSLCVPLNRQPGPVTIYYKGIESGAILQGANGGTSPRIFHIGKADNSAPRLICRSGGFYGFIHDSGALSLESTLGVAPSVGQLFELLCVLNPDGSCQISQSIAGGTVVQAAATGPNPLAANWSDRFLWVGPFVGASGMMPQRVIDCIVAAGNSFTFSDMRAVP